MKSVMTPELLKTINGFMGFGNWLKLWNRCDVKEFTGQKRALRDSKYEATLAVGVRYTCSHRPDFVNSITVSKIKGKWYWNER